MTPDVNAPGIVGRDEELKELERLLHGARSSHGRAIFLSGEEGVGKSRLALEAMNRGLTSGMYILRGRGSTVGPVTPFRPLAEALQYLCRGGVPIGDGELGPYAAILGWLVPDFLRPGCPHGKSGSPTVLGLAEAVLRLTAVIGRDRGCLIVLEDLHDADADTLAVLEYLADNLEGQPTVLLATMRAERCEALDVARAAARRHSGTFIALAGLSRDELRALVASHLRMQPDEVPGQIADRLWADSVGNPRMAEELLQDIVRKIHLVPGREGLQSAGEIEVGVPGTFVRSIARRAEQLGPHGLMLLTMAAVFGRRFPLPVVQAAIGIGDDDLHRYIQGATTAGLIAADEPSPAWYRFTHPLTSEALLGQLTLAVRAWLSRRGAEAVQVIHPELPGEWCDLAVSLQLDSGNRLGACRLLARSGTRAYADARLGSAVGLLRHAWELLAGTGDVSLRADVLEALLTSLTEAGRIDDALRLADRLDEFDFVGLDEHRKAALHSRLGWVAGVAGQWQEGMEQVRRARALAGPDVAEPYAASIDVVEAQLAMYAPGEDRHQMAQTLARRAAETADRRDLPAVGCQAWLVLGLLARSRDAGEATVCFERARTLAHAGRDPVGRIRTVFQLGIDDWLATGDTARLRQARRDAEAIEAVTVGCEIDLTIALCHVLSGEFAMGAGIVRRRRAMVKRLGLDETTRYMLMIQATLAGHQGMRREMDKALTEFGHLAGERSHLMPLAAGLARTFCTLLEEDPGGARDEMAQAIGFDTTTPGIYPLAGRYGLQVLLDVVAGNAGWSGCEEMAASPLSRLRWNRQFILFAQAVLLGRDGRSQEAAGVMAEAEQAAAPFVMARHIGLRLAAEAAAADRWGEPALWLRRAEDYFHNASVFAPASACRALLRSVGTPVPQRRQGADRVPARLRRLGVTLREYEVLQLMVNRPGNKAIGDRLYISPRTVEKHVASLMLKIGQPDRAALCEFASTLGDSVAISA